DGRGRWLDGRGLRRGAVIGGGRTVGPTARRRAGICEADARGGAGDGRSRQVGARLARSREADHGLRPSGLPRRGSALPPAEADGQGARRAEHRGRGAARGGRAQGASRALARPRARDERRVLLGDRPRRRRNPPAARPGDVRVLSRRRLVGAHPRAEANRTPVPPVGPVRRPGRAQPELGGLTPRVRPHRLLEMDLTVYRDRFPILEHTTYLINHSLGAMPAAAEERVVEYARTWRERGIRAWAEGWWEMPLTVGDQIGRIIGAPAGSTVMHQNVAVAEAIVVSCFRPVDPLRIRCVYEEGTFPSVRYLYQAQPELEVVVVPDDRAILEAIDERTLLVPITHVLFKTAEIQHVEAIVRRAHEFGAHVLLDAYQSAGIVPLDVTALNVDFAVGGSVKWLGGGPGSGCVAVRPELAW